MGQNESKAPPKRKVIQRGDCSTLAIPVGPVNSSSEIATASSSPFKEEKNNFFDKPNLGKNTTQSLNAIMTSTSQFQKPKEEPQSLSFDINQQHDQRNIKYRSQSSATCSQVKENDKEPDHTPTTKASDVIGENKSDSFSTAHQCLNNSKKRVFVTITQHVQKHDRDPILKSQEHKEDMKPGLTVSSRSQGKIKDNQHILLQDQNSDEQSVLYSTIKKSTQQPVSIPETKTQETNCIKENSPSSANQLENQANDKQPVFLSRRKSTKQECVSEPVLFSTHKSKQQKDEQKTKLLSTAQTQETKNEKQSFILPATEPKEQKLTHHQAVCLTGQPLRQQFITFHQVPKDLGQTFITDENKYSISKPVTVQTTDNKTLKKSIPSGNPFLQTTPKSLAENSKFSKEVFDTHNGDHTLIIPPLLSSSSNSQFIVNNRHIKQNESFVSSNHDSQSINFNLCINPDTAPVEACDNKKSPSKDTSMAGSTNDIIVKKTLKHVEMIAESLSKSADRNYSREQSIKQKFVNDNKARLNQRMFLDCIEKMRKVNDFDKDLVASLQKEIVAYLGEMEVFTSVLKTCPVINSDIYSFCEMVKDNLSEIKTKYESKNDYIDSTKLELSKNVESKSAMCPTKENHKENLTFANNERINLIVSPNSLEGNLTANVIKKENITEAKTTVTPLNMFKALLDKLPDYMEEEKQNISLRNTELFCSICEKPISFALLNLKEHLSGKLHRAQVASEKSRCLTNEGVPAFIHKSNSSVSIKPVLTESSAFQEVEPPVKINLFPNYKGVLDLINKSVEEGFTFGVSVFICLLCDFFENDESKALCHVKMDHKNYKNADWNLCEICLIHMYGSKTHFEEHCLTAQHINIAKLKSEGGSAEFPEDKYSPGTEFDKSSVCSEKSDISNRSRSRMTPHEILLSIAKEKKNKSIKGPFGLYCQVCRKYDTESLVFSDHLDTIQHITFYKKLHSRKHFKAKSLLNFKTCSTCEICLFGDDDIWREHQNLQTHKELLGTTIESQTNQSSELLAISFDPLEPTNLSESNSSGSHSSESNSSKQSSPDYLETNASEVLSLFNEKGLHYDFMKTVLKKNLDKGPYNDFFGLYCHFCQLYFFHQEQWKPHLLSSSHKTKVSSPENAGQNQFVCVECNIRLICDEQFFFLHLQSLAHKAISRIPGKTQNNEEPESEEEYSEDEYDSSDNEEEGNDHLPKKEETQGNANNNKQRVANIKSTPVPNGVYFRGIPQEMDEKDIVKSFGKYGQFKSLKVYKRKGSGICVFQREADANKVLSKQYVFVNNVQLIIRPLMGRQAGPQHRLDPQLETVLSSGHSIAATVSKIMADMSQTANINQQKGMEIRRDLAAVVPRCNVLFFGSQVTGLATDKSDFDLYVDYDGKSFYTDLSHDKQQQFIHNLGQLFSQQGSKFVVRETILEARVPIVSVLHRNTNKKCDISCHSGLSVENSQLVRLYLNLDPRVRWLVVAVKFWMQSNGLLDRSAFTSYATIWLVLFFLMRTTNPVVCPVVTLQQNCKPHFVARWDCRFHRDKSDIMKYFRPYNKQTELELLSAFFQTYASFSFNTNVMCPLNGQILPRKKFEILNLPQEFDPYREKIKSSKSAERLKIKTPICLQDPFDLSHNVTKGVCRADLIKFKTLCLQSYQLCQTFLGR